MIKRIVILVFLVFFVPGTITAMAASGPVAHRNNVLQSMYNWFGTWDKLCVDKSERCCKACGKKCCYDCNINCGGTCCSNCGKK
jgi:hypothetical protein